MDISRGLRRAWSAALGQVSGLKPAALAVMLGAVFLLTHLPFVAPGPDSIDAMNFALGVRDFDVSDHRPHPPGYPVFVAMGKLTRPLVPAGSDHLETVRYESRALAVWSAAFGALAVVPLFIIFRFLDKDDRRAGAATLLAVTCPLFWFLAVRPMSDIPGLGAALIVQALLFSAHESQVRQLPARARRLLIAAALGSGLVIGLRSQTMWLTMPLLAVVSWKQLVTAERRFLGFATVAAAFIVGVALWAVPLAVASGGLHSYQVALTAQAGEDFTDVQMLFQDPSVRRLLTGLVSTVAHPWANKYLASIVVLLAAIGFGAMLLRSRPVLGWLLVAAGPYIVFHLLFQDPEFTRYALPATPFVAYLAVRGVDVLASRTVPWLTLALAVGSLAVAARPVLGYSNSGSAAYQATAAVRRALMDAGDARPVIAADLAVARAIRGEQFPTKQLPSPRSQEWLEVVKYWRAGGIEPVWFLGDSSRTDLALFDASAQHLRGAFRMPFSNRFLMGGERPAGVNWVEVREPGWMAGTGWALTPQAAGVAWRDMKGPGHAPVTAWVRRRPEAAVMMIGGRNLGHAGLPDIRFEVTLEGRPLESWAIAPDPGYFLRTVQLPAGSLNGSGRYAELRVSAQPTDGVIRQVNAAVEQFDVQSADRVVYGFDTGWYHLEYDAAAKQYWRWTGPWARLRVHQTGRPLTLHLAGPSPLEYLTRAPNITVRAGDRVLGTLTPTDAFVMDVPVPADVLAAANGVLTLETDLTFVPDDRLHNGDRRSLGLRIYAASLVDGLDVPSVKGVALDNPGHSPPRPGSR